MFKKQRFIKKRRNQFLIKRVSWYFNKIYSTIQDKVALSVRKDFSIVNGRTYNKETNITNTSRDFIDKSQLFNNLYITMKYKTLTRQVNSRYKYNSSLYIKKNKLNYLVIPSYNSIYKNNTFFNYTVNKDKKVSNPKQALVFVTNYKNTWVENIKKGKTISTMLNTLFNQTLDIKKQYTISVNKFMSLKKKKV